MRNHTSDASMSSTEEVPGTTNIRAEGDNARLTVKISLKPRFGKENLKEKYKVGKYSLSEGYSMGPSLQALVPKGTPDYVEHGENYVERIMRALYHFKQCALIGPSGTGKSVRGTEEVDVIRNGKRGSSTIEGIFESLKGAGKRVDAAGSWETIRVGRDELLVLSFDRRAGEIVWRSPAAIARSAYAGPIAVVTTATGRKLAATPDHSFVTLDGTVKASDLKPGVFLPVVNTTPAPSIVMAIGGTSALQSGRTIAKWERVVEVKMEAHEGWVYDFEVPGTETFVAGDGIVTHNTHITYLVAELAGLPLWEINCGLQTSVYDLFGRFVGLGKENWVDGQIVSWCRYGGILYLDEANMMKQDIATRLNPILDTRGHMVLNERDNEVIPRHPNGFVMISMNPYSAEFAGTKPLNAAFRRRMTVWIDFDYLSVGSKIAPDEVEMIAQRAKIGSPVAEKLVRVAAEIRRQYKTGDLPYAPSVGDLVNWGTLVADGLTPALAAEETIIALTADDPEVQNNVRRIVRMVVGDAKAGSK